MPKSRKRRKAVQMERTQRQAKIGVPRPRTVAPARLAPLPADDHRTGGTGACDDESCQECASYFCDLAPWEAWRKADADVTAGRDDADVMDHVETLRFAYDRSRWTTLREMAAMNKTEVSALVAHMEQQHQAGVFEWDGECALIIVTTPEEEDDRVPVFGR